MDSDSFLTRFDNTAPLVQVSFGGYTTYTYQWTGKEPVQIGDTVLVPAAYWQDRNAPPQKGQVVALGSDYTGPVVSINRKAAVK